MTSSESGPAPLPEPLPEPVAEPLPEPLPEPAPGAQILAMGHLHPGILFLRLATALRGIVIPVVLGLFVLSGAASIGILAFGLLMMLLQMGYAVARFVTFRYWLTTEELITTEGVFNRQERRIPVNRIQDLSFEQTLVRRFFGLVTVTVETASGEGAEARLDALGTSAAHHLREVMYYIRQARSPVSADQADETLRQSFGGQPTYAGDVPEEVLFRVRPWDLTLRGLTDNRGGAILLGLVVLLDQANQYGFFGMAEDAIDRVVEQISAMDVTLAAGLLVGVLVAFVVLGWIASIAASFLLFHGFVLVRRGEVFQRRYGLLTTRARSLPQQKIQRVLLEQTLFRRIFRLVVVRADSAGSGANQREELKGGLDVVAPLTRLELGRALVPQLLPGMDATSMAWSPVSPKVVTRMLLQGLVVGGLGLLIAWPFAGPLALLALFYPAILLGWGALLYQNLGYAHPPGHFAMRWGVLGRYRAYIPLRKVQAVALRAGPVDRAFGLARIVVYVAGAAPTMLQHLTRADARRVQQGLAAAAAQSRFVW